jgi:hypothetical protein
MKILKHLKFKSEIVEVIKNVEQLLGILYAYREMRNQIDRTICEVHWCIDKILEIPHREMLNNTNRLEGNILLIDIYQLISLEKFAIFEDLDKLIQEQETFLEELKKVSGYWIVNLKSPLHKNAADAFFELETLLDLYHDVFSWPTEFVKIYDVHSNIAWETYFTNPKLFEEYILQLDNTIAFRKSGELYSMTMYDIDLI